jgi:tRNA-dihydrouridine synthase
MVQDAGAAAIAVHGRTAEQSYTGMADWSLVAQIAESLDIPVLGSGDCVEPTQILEKMSSGVSGVLVGRGVLRNPWILSQAAALVAGRTPRTISAGERGRFLLEYIELLLQEQCDEAQGFRHAAPGAEGSTVNAPPREARGRQRWVINKLRALCAWYTKGLDAGSGLRVRVNAATSIDELRAVVHEFFLTAPATVTSAELLSSRR